MIHQHYSAVEVNFPGSDGGTVCATIGQSLPSFSFDTASVMGIPITWLRFLIVCFASVIGIA